ncbi:hypothetical protein N665_0077s0028 [Sinapis alba]|nr:hypothetical protein N665_0077s0028 [Sinapis alba]
MELTYSLPEAMMQHMAPDNPPIHVTKAEDANDVSDEGEEEDEDEGEEEDDEGDEDDDNLDEDENDEGENDDGEEEADIPDVAEADNDGEDYNEYGKVNDIWRFWSGVGYETTGGIHEEKNANWSFSRMEQSYWMFPIWRSNPSTCSCDLRPSDNLGFEADRRREQHCESRLLRVACSEF